MITFKDISLRRLIDKKEKIDTKHQSFFDSIKPTLSTAIIRENIDTFKLKLDFLKELLLYRVNDIDYIEEDPVKMRLLALVESDGDRYYRTFKKDSSYSEFPAIDLSKNYRLYVFDNRDNHIISKIKNTFLTYSKVIMYTYHNNSYSLLHNVDNMYNSDIAVSLLPITADLSIITADTTKILTNDTNLEDQLSNTVVINNQFDYLQSLIDYSVSSSFQTDSKSKLISKYRSVRDKKFSLGNNDKALRLADESYKELPFVNNIKFSSIDNLVIATTLSYSYSSESFTINISDNRTIMDKVFNKLYLHDLNLKEEDSNTSEYELIEPDKIRSFLESIDVLENWRVRW